MNSNEFELMAKTSQLADSDAKEWLVLHSYLTDKETGKCAISPPMLALTWDMAVTVFDSLIEAALGNMGRKQGEAFLARLEDTEASLRVGIFAEMSEKAYPEEVFMLLDRRAMTMELYTDMYLKGTTGGTFVAEIPIRSGNSPQLH